MLMKTGRILPVRLQRDFTRFRVKLHNSVISLFRNISLRNCYKIKSNEIYGDE